MKKIINNIFTLVVILASQTIAFAQETPGDFGSSSTPGDSNATDTPIDTYVWILLIVGFVYVFSKYKTRSKA